MKHAFFSALLTGTIILLAFGCRTVPEDIPEDLSPMEYFQNAQNEMDRENLRGALVYYETFLERYPDDQENGIAAEYWVANIQRKLGDRETAREGFRELLAKEADLRGRVPDWPFVLTRSVMEEMGEEPPETPVQQPAAEQPGGIPDGQLPIQPEVPEL